MGDLPSAFQRAARVSRAMLYGTDHDHQLPRNLHHDARVPFLGFVGPAYRPGNPVLLAINPGGGGDAYVTRTPQDRELIPLIERFVAAPPEQLDRAFDDMCRSYAAQVRTWNLWRILGPTLAACRSDLDAACYLNLFPYRTQGDKRPTTVPLRNAWTHIVDPLLKALAPGLLVALGKKAGGEAERYHRPPPPLFVVPRTIGDSSVSAEAQAVLATIRGLRR
ncbi:MAG: hypothetical protein JNM50_05245 [Chromatiales bacterium]|nr:hypothetical protein [Chromatiales bacterium]